MQTINSKEIKKISGGMCCVIIAPKVFQFSGNKCDPGFTDWKYNVLSYEECQNECGNRNKKTPKCCRLFVFEEGFLNERFG